MTITYANGTTVEGIVLARTDGMMRLALRGCGDSVELAAGPEGTWVSEFGETVRIGSTAAQADTAEVLDEFICPQDLVAHLVDYLDQSAAPLPAPAFTACAAVL